MKHVVPAQGSSSRVKYLMSRSILVGWLFVKHFYGLSMPYVMTWGHISLHLFAGLYYSLSVYTAACNIYTDWDTSESLVWVYYISLDHHGDRVWSYMRLEHTAHGAVGSDMATTSKTKSCMQSFQLVKSTVRAKYNAERASYRKIVVKLTHTRPSILHLRSTNTVWRSVGTMLKQYDHVPGSQVSTSNKFQDEN